MFVFSFDGLSSLWPVTMEIDYIRVYQPKGEVNIVRSRLLYPRVARLLTAIASAIGLRPIRPPDEQVYPGSH